MINIGLWADERDWVLYLLKNYGNKLLGEEPEKVVHYGFALYYCYTKEQRQARIHLNILKEIKRFSDISLERLVGVLEIKLLYQEEEEDLLRSRIQSFKMFNHRNQQFFDKTIYQATNRFINMVVYIDRLREGIRLRNFFGDSLATRFANIKNELSEPPTPISEIVWLNEIVDELKNSSKT